MHVKKGWSKMKTTERCSLRTKDSKKVKNCLTFKEADKGKKKINEVSKSAKYIELKEIVVFSLEKFRF